jgi:hypothetical protein
VKSAEASTSAGVFLTALVLYLLTLPRLGFNSDVYAYAALIPTGTGAELYQAHHLLYNPTGRWWLRALEAVVGPLRHPDMALRGMNAFFGAAAVLGFHVFAGSLLRGSRRLLATAAFASSFAVWIFSVDIEVYVPSTAFLLGSAVALRPQEPSADGRRIVLAGVLLGMAALYHQMGALFVVPGALSILSGPGTAVARGRRAAGFALVGGGVALVPYVLAGAAYHGVASLGDFVRFVLGYSLRGYGVGWSLGSLPEAALGHGRSLVFFGWVLEALQARHPGALFGLGVAGLVGLLLAAGGLGAALGWRRAPGDRKFLIFLLAWYATYAFFAAWWEPYNPEFWVSALPAFWALLAGGLDRAGGRWPGLLAAVVPLAFLSNLADVLARKDTSRDIEVVAVQAVAAQAGEAAVLLSPTLYVRGLIFAPGLSGINVYQACKASPGDAGRALELLEEQVAAAARAGRTVLMVDRAFSPEVLRPHPWCRETEASFRAAHSLREVFRVELLLDDGEGGRRSLARRTSVPVFAVGPCETCRSDHE